MKRRINRLFKIKYVLMIMTILLLGSIVLTYIYGGNITTFKNQVMAFFSPVRQATSSLVGVFSDAEERRKTNEALSARVDELTAENAALQEKLSRYQNDIYEMEQLRKLLDLKKDFEDYETIGANVIGKNTGNWIYEFTIDRGSDDGVEVDMNVLADGGLAGIVTDVGPNYAVVTSILADDMNVSAVSSTSRDSCIVTGDLELLQQGVIRVMYIHKDAAIKEYDRLITSTTSNKYLPHILIGYVKDITVDNNDLTKSGYVVPAVDFEHLENVLVVLQKKITTK